MVRKLGAALENCYTRRVRERESERSEKRASEREREGEKVT